MRYDVIRDTYLEKFKDIQSKLVKFKECQVCLKNGIGAPVKPPQEGVLCYGHGNEVRACVVKVR